MNHRASQDHGRHPPRGFAIRSVLVIFALAWGLGQAGPSLAQSTSTGGAAGPAFPWKTIKIVVASGAGGQSHVVSQFLAEKLRERMAGSYVVEPKPGASGVLAMESVIREPADGHTIFYGVAGQLSTAPAFLKNFKIDVLKEFRPVVRLGMPPQCLFINVQTPAKTAREFATWARARPQGVTLASFGHGSTSHLQGALFAKLAGFKMVHVPFRGSPEGIQEVAGGRVDAFIIDFAPARGLMDAGAVRCLALTGTARWPEFPAIPTFQDEGFALPLVGWHGLFVVAGTPDAIVKHLYDEVAAIVGTEPNKKRLIEMGLLPALDGPEGFAKFHRNDITKWAEAIGTLGIKPE